eukprot:scaffold542_cov154-Skeletonema_menzelii.AAC.13
MRTERNACCRSERTVPFSSTELSIDDLLMTDAPPLPNPVTVVKGCTRTKKTTTNSTTMVENGRGRFARRKDVQIKLFKEDSAFGMGPRLKGMQQ